jgi:hypothetical protein
MDGKTNPIPEVTGIEISDICGLWEVIRIYQDNGQRIFYPWIKDRFKFNFLPEMIFLRLKDGYNSHGTWELVDRENETSERYSIVLNGNVEYHIQSINEDDMVLSDQKHSYFLVKRL